MSDENTAAAGESGRPMLRVVRGTPDDAELEIGRAHV